MDMSAGGDMTAQIAESHYPLGDVEAGLNLSFTVIAPATKYFKAVIPAPHLVRDKLQPESRKTLDAESSPA